MIDAETEARIDALEAELRAQSLELMEILWAERPDLAAELERLAGR